MKFKIEKEVLDKAIKKCNEAIDNKSPLDWQNCFKFVVKTDKIAIISLNDGMTIRNVLNEVKDCEEGEFLVDAKMLSTIISKCKDEITFSKKAEKILIKNKKSKFELSTIDVKTFAKVEFKRSDLNFTIDYNDFKNIVESMKNSVSDAQTKPVLKCINFVKEKGKDKFCCYATDSYQLSKNSLKANINKEIDLNFKVERKDLEKIIKIFDEGELNFDYSKNFITVNQNNIIFKSTMVEGVYPNIEKLIPTDFFGFVELKLFEWLELTKKFNLFKDLSSNVYVVNMEIDEQNGKNIVSFSSSTEIGNYSEKVDNAKVDCQKVTISFNGDYFKKQIDNFKYFLNDDAILKLNINGMLKPVVFNSEKCELLGLLLPVRTN